MAAVRAERHSFGLTSCLHKETKTTTMAETLTLRGQLKGHSGWVTSIATPLDNSDMLLSSSRDKSVILWTITREEGNYGFARRALKVRTGAIAPRTAAVAATEADASCCGHGGPERWRQWLMRLLRLLSCNRATPTS